ncbi:uncharacterized protein An01g13450 [Aspergillus niger]|uniref:Contig An01c0400, genomic contig n=2 Tax=Aspergillus niger TaxID=5061 RepID=A2QB06_ASPNC|nr:uncharacterized protein An01g13450 [Aspergillus niger]CAK96214.1 unnamed protein product [Aspergillus niger]
MDPKNVISTTIYSVPGSVEYTARIAKILARRLKTPVYVGGSIEPTTMGVMAEEEIEGVKRIVEVIVKGWEGVKSNGNAPDQLSESPPITLRGLSGTHRGDCPFEY